MEKTNVKFMITPSDIDRYLSEVDPALQRLEALTAQLISTRHALTGDASSERFQSLLDLCVEAQDDALPEILKAMLNGWAILAKVPQRTEDQWTDAC